MQQIVGSLGGTTTVVNGSSVQETRTVLMQQLEQYNGLNQVGNSDFAKSNPLSIASFEPEQYLRTDSFEIKPRTDNFDIKPSTSRFDVARYSAREAITLYLDVNFQLPRDSHEDANIHCSKLVLVL